MEEFVKKIAFARCNDDAWGLHGVLPVPTPFSSTSTEEGEGVSPSTGPTEQVL